MKKLDCGLGKLGMPCAEAIAKKNIMSVDMILIK